MAQQTAGAEPTGAVRWRVLVAALPLATGGALVIYILAGRSLPTALLLTVLCTGATALYGWTRLGPLARLWVARRARAGLVAGIAATASYDLVRLALVKFGHFTFWPFDIFGVFGRALVGTAADPFVLRAAGVTYHLANGICFGIAYSLIWGKRGPLFGLIWGLALETFMVSLYPGWLHIDALLGEFLSVSLLGHITYGVVLGTVAQRLLRDGA